MANLKNLVDVVGSLEATFQHPAMPKLLREARGCGTNHIIPYQITHFHPMIGEFFAIPTNTSTIVTKCFFFPSNCGKRGDHVVVPSRFSPDQRVFSFLFLENKVFPLSQIEQHQSLSTLRLQGTLFPCTDDCTFKYHIALCKRHVFIRNGTSQVKG